ncbi:hypothetical protein B0H12DRAFT_1111164 [Mycena haematopus]|nr:hypothetical protein B0H12DRAFT_1111164 [Mycena haematopus]
MPRTTTLIIETLGGAPVFHIPFPISTLPFLAGVSREEKGLEQPPNDNNDTTEPEHVNLIFRNRGGTPTFHVGGAEVGVGPADAWDYTRVIKAVMAGRAARVAGENGLDVRVKVEEETPRVPSKGKGKEKERQREGQEAMAEQDGRQGTSLHPLSAEERYALSRGSLHLRTLQQIRAQGQEEFALALDPALPTTRALSPEEEKGWWALWDALLKLDRWFWGPLRDIDALQARSEAMVAAAAERVRVRSSLGVKPQPRHRREGFYVAPQDDDSRPASGQSKHDPPTERVTPIPTPLQDLAPREDGRGDPHTDAVVRHLRRALDPLRGAMRDVNSDAAISRSSRSALSVARVLTKDSDARLSGSENQPEYNLKKDLEKAERKENAWPPVRLSRSRAKENGVQTATTRTSIARTDADTTTPAARGRVSVAEAGTKRIRTEGDGDAPTKRARKELEPPPPPMTMKTRSGSTQANVETKGMSSPLQFLCIPYHLSPP